MRSTAAVFARRAGIAVAALIAFALLFPLAYSLVMPAPDRPMVSLPPPPAGRYTIYVADWGYHTSIVIPQAPAWSLGPTGREHTAYVEYAWGDRRFYRDSDYRPHSVFATLVLPTASVAYIAGRDRPPSRDAGARAVYSREVDAATLHVLAVDLERTIRHDSAGARLPPSEPVAGYAGRVHDAHGAYLWARDCNRWTVERLAAASIAGSGALVVFSGQVAGRLRGFTPS